MVVLVSVSRTKMSGLLLVSPGTMLEASELNATNRPSAEMEGLSELRSSPDCLLSLLRRGWWYW